MPCSPELTRKGLAVDFQPVTAMTVAKMNASKWLMVFVTLVV
jgi:hypothetical protein